MTDKAFRAIAEGLEDAIASDGHGRGKASEATRDGVCLEEREAKLAALRATLDASIAAGGVVSDEEIDAALDETCARLAREGVLVHEA